jgi:two-component system, sensor histidine kinase PdtaS
MLAPNPAETEFKILADNAPVMIWRSGLDMLCDWFNKPWLDFTGRPIEAELGNGWTEGVHPEDYERCLDTYTGAFARRESFTMEYRLRRHDGEYRWLLDNGKPYWRGGVFAGYFGSCIDVNHHRDTETRLEQALETRELLLREVHHRVRNNLQNLTSLIRILEIESGMRDGEERSLLRSLDRRIHAMAAIQFALHDAELLPAISARRFVGLLLLSFADAHPETHAELAEAHGDCEIGMSEAPHLGLAIFETLLYFSGTDRREGRISFSDRASHDCIRIDLCPARYSPENAPENAAIAPRLAKVFAQSAGFSLTFDQGMDRPTARLTRL